jgi:hypothetical protein
MRIFFKKPRPLASKAARSSSATYGEPIELADRNTINKSERASARRRPPVRSEGASTSAESDDYSGAPCRRRSLPPPSSCCRRCRAGRPAIEPERLVMGVEHRLLGLPKVDAHKRHAAVRQLHVRRLDRQRQALERESSGSSRTGRLRQAQSSSAHRLGPELGSEARRSEAPVVVLLALRAVNPGRRRGRASLACHCTDTARC